VAMAVPKFALVYKEKEKERDKRDREKTTSLKQTNRKKK
jgi:hypothetical protein